MFSAVSAYYQYQQRLPSVAHFMNQPCLQPSLSQLSIVTLYFRMRRLVRVRSLTSVMLSLLHYITFGADNKSVAISLKHSKTLQEGNSAIINIVNIKSAYKHLCLVLSLGKFFKLRPNVLGSLFCHVNGAPIKH